MGIGLSLLASHPTCQYSKVQAATHPAILPSQMHVIILFLNQRLYGHGLWLKHD